jgi:hypothetical protein
VVVAAHDGRYRHEAIERGPAKSSLRDWACQDPQGSESTKSEAHLLLAGLGLRYYIGTDGDLHQEDRGYREQLTTQYGAAIAKEVKYAEAFEICEYGRQPTEQQIRALFPFFDQK